MARARARLSPSRTRSASVGADLAASAASAMAGLSLDVVPAVPWPIHRSRVPRVIRLARFLARNRMLTPKYGRLLWRYLWHRLLTPAGWRWRTSGMLFLGRRLELQI